MPFQRFSVCPAFRHIVDRRIFSVFVQGVLDAALLLVCFLDQLFYRFVIFVDFVIKDSGRCHNSDHDHSPFIVLMFIVQKKKDVLLLLTLTISDRLP